MTTDLLALLLSAVMLFSGEELEKPPDQYLRGPISAQYLYVNNPNNLCRSIFGNPGKNFRGCYTGAEKDMDMIILPQSCDPKYGPVGEMCRRLIEHEEGHARGWRHDPAPLPDWLKKK